MLENAASYWCNILCKASWPLQREKAELHNSEACSCIGSFAIDFHAKIFFFNYKPAPNYNLEPPPFASASYLL